MNFNLAFQPKRADDTAPTISDNKMISARGLSKGVILGVGLALAVSGCTRSSNLNQGGTLPTQQNPAKPLQPAPLTPVNQGQLQPVQPTTPAAPETPAVPEKPKPVEVAKVNSANAKPVTRQAMVGAWTVATGGSNCQIFLALTKWSGGYRAASRGCSAAAISDVQAWDVKGKQVVLVNSSGGTAATLFRSSDSRFDGSTTGGGAISFSR